MSSTHTTIEPVPNASFASADLHPEVAALDLDLVRHKLAEPDDGSTPLTGEVLGYALDEYRRYLTLVVSNPTTPLVPTKLIDRVWHAHILDTRRYAADCDRIFGHFMHHDPSLGIGGEQAVAQLNAMFDITAAIYEARFAESYRRDAASRCEGHACHAPSSCACRTPGACKSMS